LKRSTGESFKWTSILSQDGKYSHTNELGATSSGSFSISGNVLTSLEEGYSQTLGKMVTKKFTREITTLGFQEKGYYLDEKTNQYIEYWKGEYSLVH